MSDEVEKNNVMNFPSEDMDNLRILEALLFAANEPLDAESLKARLPKGTNLNKLLNLIEAQYKNRGELIWSKLAINGALKLPPILHQ